MKQTWIFVAVIGALVLGGLYIMTRPDTEVMPEEVVMLDESTSTVTGPVTVTPISHATGILSWGTDIIYMDPVGEALAFVGQPAPTIILLTDVHGDHLSTSTLTAVMTETARLIVPQAVYDLLPPVLAAKAEVMNNDEVIIIDGLQITAMPMYNLPETEDSRHAKGRGNGYLLERDGYRVYIAGDTAGIPEMRALTDIDMAFVPMNLPYTMSPEEAADAVLDFAPAKVIPYHYRTPDGPADVTLFKRLVEEGSDGIEVVLLPWYETAE